MPFYCHPEVLNPVDVVFVEARIAGSRQSWSGYYTARLTPIASDEATLQALAAISRVPPLPPAYSQSFSGVPPEVFSALFQEV